MTHLHRWCSPQPLALPAYLAGPRLLLHLQHLPHMLHFILADRYPINPSHLMQAPAFSCTCNICNKEIQGGEGWRCGTCAGVEEQLVGEGRWRSAVQATAQLMRGADGRVATAAPAHLPASRMPTACPNLLATAQHMCHPHPSSADFDMCNTCFLNPAVPRHEHQLVVRPRSAVHAVVHAVHAVVLVWFCVPSTLQCYVARRPCCLRLAFAVLPMTGNSNLAN